MQEDRTGVASISGAQRARMALEEAIGWAAGRPPLVQVDTVGQEEVRRLEPELLQAGLERMLLEARPDLGLEALLRSGLLGVVLPEVEALVGLKDYEWRHKDVWLHTRQVVVQAPPEPALRWAALLHDIGKTRTRKIGDDGKISFIGHPEVGARMFDRIVRRERWFAQDRELCERIRFLILHHQRAGQYEQSWTDSAVRRFAREMGAYLGDLLVLARADMTTRHQAKRRRNLLALEDLERRIAELAAEDAREPPLPSGLGNELMRAFGLPPSPRIGELKRALEAAVAAGELPARAAPGVYIEFIEQSRQRFGLPEG